MRPPVFSLHAAERTFTDRVVIALALVMVPKIAREESPRIARTLARAVAFSVARRARLIRKGARHGA